MVMPYESHASLQSWIMSLEVYPPNIFLDRLFLHAKSTGDLGVPLPLGKKIGEHVSASVYSCWRLGDSPSEPPDKGEPYRTEFLVFDTDDPGAGSEGLTVINVVYRSECGIAEYNATGE